MGICGSSGICSGRSENCCCCFCTVSTIIITSGLDRTTLVSSWKHALAKWATAWQKQKNLCPQWRLRSAWASDQISLIRGFAVHMKKHWVFIYPLSAHQRLWSNWADAQADLSLHWAHMSFCWFCHVAAQIIRDLSILRFFAYRLPCTAHQWSQIFGSLSEFSSWPISSMQTVKAPVLFL